MAGKNLKILIFASVQSHDLLPLWNFILPCGLFQDGVGMGVESTGWESEDPALEENETGTDPVRVLMLPLQAHHAMEKMEEFVLKVGDLVC